MLCLLLLLLIVQRTIILKTITIVMGQSSHIKIFKISKINSSILNLKWTYGLFKDYRVVLTNCIRIIIPSLKSIEQSQWTNQN